MVNGNRPPLVKMTEVRTGKLSSHLEWPISHWLPPPIIALLLVSQARPFPCSADRFQYAARKW